MRSSRVILSVLCLAACGSNNSSALDGEDGSAVSGADGSAVSGAGGSAVSGAGGSAVSGAGGSAVSGAGGSAVSGAGGDRDGSVVGGEDGSVNGGQGGSVVVSGDGGMSVDSGGTLPQPPASCVGLPTTCGASGKDNCCHSLAVNGGTYYRGYDKVGDNNSGDMNNPATVSSFRLDKYEVTVGRFRAFVNAGQGTQENPPSPGAGAHKQIANSGWIPAWNQKLPARTADMISGIKACFSYAQGDGSTYLTWTDTPAADTENRPINCISFYDATAFCIWDGGYLPTEAEWNYAAAGGDEQRAYPWSNPAASLTIDSSYASYKDGTNCVGDGKPGCAVTDLIPVGSKPNGDGLWGHSDLGGNVWEWMLDGIGLYPNPCVDCAQLMNIDRVIRGGSFGSSTFFMRARSRSTFPPGDPYAVVGVRCARAL